MKSLLILTDFSENAFRAAQYASGLTGPLGVNRFVLYYAYQTIIAGTEIPVIMGNQQILRESMQELALLRDRIKSMVDSRLVIDLMAEDCSLPDRINPLCKEQSIDMIVMGISGKSGLEKLLIGSTTIQIQRISRFPLLIVPHEALIGSVVSLQSDVRHPDSIIVFATDLKDFPAVLADQLGEILNAFHADLHVVNIGPEGAENHSAQNQETLAGVRALLSPYAPKFHFIQGDDIAERILAFSELHRALMIVAVHRKHGFFSTLIHQSISKKLAYNSNIPLLSMPDL